MKNATKHAVALKALQKKLLKQHGTAEKPPGLKPMAALIAAVFRSDCADIKAEKALEQIHDHFIDYNELRVATELELLELFGTRYPEVEQRLARLHGILNTIFERESGLTLDRFDAMKVKEKREFLRELPGMTPFIEGFVLLYAAEAAAFPVDESMFAVLQAADCVDEDADLAEVQKFIEQQLKAEELHPFFAALRAEAAEGGLKKKPIRRKTA